jgi:hypothetical protein
MKFRWFLFCALLSRLWLTTGRAQIASQVTYWASTWGQRGSFARLFKPWPSVLNSPRWVHNIVQSVLLGNVTTTIGKSTCEEVLEGLCKKVSVGGGHPCEFLGRQVAAITCNAILRTRMRPPSPSALVLHPSGASIPPWKTMQLDEPWPVINYKKDSLVLLMARMEIIIVWRLLNSDIKVLYLQNLWS